MAVEYLEDGSWVQVDNATARQIDAERYLVTITGLPIWVRLTALDGAPLRIDGKVARNVWGTRKTGDTVRGFELTLDVLV
jgi:hypothetical protein